MRRRPSGATHPPATHVPGVLPPRRAALTAIVDIPTPPLLLTNDTIRPNRPNSRTGDRWTRGGIRPVRCSILAAARKSFTPARMAWMRIVLSERPAKNVRSEYRRHGRLWRDERGFLRKNLQRPNISFRFHRRDLRAAAAGSFDRLTNVARVMNYGV